MVENGNEPHKAVKVHRPCQPENDGQVTVNIMALPNYSVELNEATNFIAKQNTMSSEKLGKGRREEYSMSTLAGHVSPWKVLSLSSRK